MLHPSTTHPKYGPFTLHQLNGHNVIAHLENKGLVGSNKCLSWEDMSFKFGIGLIGLCENYYGSHNPKIKDDALLKPA